MNVNQEAKDNIRKDNLRGILHQDGLETLLLTIMDRYTPLMASAIMIQMQIDELDLFEIYVFNSVDLHEGVYEGKKAGEVSGWDIKWVLGTKEGIKTFPWFDEIITTNDNSTGRRDTAILWK